MATDEYSTTGSENSLTPRELHIIGHAYAVAVEESFEEFYDAYEDLYRTHKLPDSRGTRTMEAVEQFEEAAKQYLEVNDSEYDEKKELANTASMNGLLAPNLLDEKMDKDEFRDLFD